MKYKKLCITTDCACDLPGEWLRENEVDVVYFYITTETGIFRDVDEISAHNIFEYMNNNGRRTETKAPCAEELRSFFEKKLENCDELLHIVISAKISKSAKHAIEAAALMGEKGKRIHIFDSAHLSTGLGHMVMTAVEMAQQDRTVPEIIGRLTDMRDHISTSFIVNTAEYLYRNEKISRSVMQLCSTFKIHPVFRMKNGDIRLCAIQIGSYERSIQRYLRRMLKDPDTICKDRAFITHASCTHNDVELIRRTIADHVRFDEVIVSKASATISCNCGPRSAGVLFVRK